MEPVTIAVIATAVFGAVTALSVFIRQLLLSRDKNLNDKAQQRALAQESRELEKLRKQMENNKRFDSHYQVLGANKDAIQYLDQKIEEILTKKFGLIQRYSQMAVKESSAIIDSGQISERKAVCDLLRQEIDFEIKFYDDELKQLQARRASLWDSHSGLQVYLLDQEKSRNEKLDTIYQSHTGVLEKIYLRHNRNAEQIAKQTIDAGNQTFKFLTAPWQLLMQFFKLSSGISPNVASKEKASREEVAKAEQDINGDSDNDLDQEVAEKEEATLEMTS